MSGCLSNSNVAFGYQALNTGFSTSGGNSVLGYQALFNTTNGGSNVAIGNSALYNNTTGFSNTAVGQSSLSGNITGTWNVAIGLGTGASSSNGTFNTYLGYAADSANGLTNATAIGASAYVNASNKVRIGDVNVTLLYFSYDLIFILDNYIGIIYNSV